MQKHRDKLQKEKETALLKTLRPVLPHLPAAVLRLAAEEAQWELEPTVDLLQLFQTACQQQLRELAEVFITVLATVVSDGYICSSHHLQPLLTACCLQTGPIEAEALQSSGESSGSDSDKVDEKKTKKEGKRKSKRKQKNKESRDKKRSKREAEPEPLVCWSIVWLCCCRIGSKQQDCVQAVTDQYGKYGVIRESDMYRLVQARTLQETCHACHHQSAEKLTLLHTPQQTS